MSVSVAPVVAAVVLAASGAIALAQYRVGPIYPESPDPPVVQNAGYNPFVLDSRTGRFNYVPIPYDAEPPPGRGYNPYRFNWHSGRWDYVPRPLERDVQRWEWEERRRAADDTGGNASNYIDTRADAPGELSLRAEQASAKLPPENGRALREERRDTVRYRQATSVPTTRPTTGPAEGKAQPANRRPPEGKSLGGGWVELKGVVGRWEYDYLTNRWIFVLPDDD